MAICILECLLESPVFEERQRRISYQSPHLQIQPNRQSGSWDCRFHRKWQ